MAKENLAELAKKEYDELTKRKTDLQSEIEDINGKVKPLELFLQASGVLVKKEASKRGPKAKSVAEAAQA